jgi:hypothetical protein
MSEEKLKINPNNFINIPNNNINNFYQEIIPNEKFLYKNTNKSKMTRDGGTRLF